MTTEQITSAALVNLGKVIVAHPYFRGDDTSVVAQICQRPPLDGDVNSLFYYQDESTANAAYLLGVYTGIVQKVKDNIDKSFASKDYALGPHQSGTSTKWTSQTAKERWLLASDPEYAIQTSDLHDAEQLVYLIKLLFDLVDKRTRMLENLSNNYRQELKTDQH